MGVLGAGLAFTSTPLAVCPPGYASLLGPLVQATKCLNHSRLLEGCSTVSSRGNASLCGWGQCCSLVFYLLCALAAQSCPALRDPMDCSLPGSSVHGILQARTLELVAVPFSRRSSRPRDWTRVSHIVGKRFAIWATREVRYMGYIGVFIK